MPSKQQKHWYDEFFHEDYLKVFGDEFTPERATAEVAFLEKVLGLKRGQQVLDLACGQGRHAVPLAQHGMQVTGLDLMPDYLAMAKKSAKAAKVELELVQSDMRQIPFKSRFDAVINMYTAFGYLETEEDDLQVLREVAKALKPGGKVLLDLWNREWAIRNMLTHEWREAADGTLYLEHRQLNLATSRVKVSVIMVPPNGPRHDSIGWNVRIFSLTELSSLIERAGLHVLTVYGGYESQSYTLNSDRMILVAQK